LMNNMIFFIFGRFLADFSKFVLILANFGWF
jgi:hypothetical protein